MAEQKGANGATPASFLERLGSDLEAKTGIDADLAKILSTHILSASAKPDCVANARKAIADLAKIRALPRPKES